MPTKSELMHYRLQAIIREDDGLDISKPDFGREEV